MAESNREEIAKLEALYANNPGGRVFTHLAEAYRKAGELDRARRILDDGIERHADSASAHVVLGRVLQDQGKVSEAATAFQRVLELDPENRVALRSLGDLSRNAGRRDDALGFYRQLQSLDPGDDDLAITIHRLQSEPLAEEPKAEAPALEAASEPAATPHFAADGAVAPEQEATTSGDPGFFQSEIAPEATESDQEAEPAEGAPWAVAPTPAEPEVTEEAAPFMAGEAELSFEMSVEPEAEVVDAVDPSAELDRAASFEAMLSTGPESAQPPESDVPTETLAELYRTQGFYDRSVEVYRSLLQRRPGDSVLESRLREVEQLAGEPSRPDDGMTIEFELAPEADYEADTAASQPPPPEVEDEEAREEWMAGVASGWAESDRGAPVDDGLYAWQDEPADSDQSGPSLGEYFQRLLDWQPRQPAAAQEPEAPEIEPILVLERDETAVSFGDEAEPPTVAVPLMEWEPPFLDEEPVAEAVPPTPMHATPSAPVRRTVSENPVDAAFDEWFEGVPAGTPEPVDATAPTNDYAPEPLMEAAEAAPAPAAEPSSALNDESDDDLEMFRSWLQSLKR